MNEFSIGAIVIHNADQWQITAIHRANGLYEIGKVGNLSRRRMVEAADLKLLSADIPT
jgi:hypothetical protein